MLSGNEAERASGMAVAARMEEMGRTAASRKAAHSSFGYMCLRKSAGVEAKLRNVDCIVYYIRLGRIKAEKRVVK